MTCQLRTDPEAVLAEKMADRFALIERLVEETHHWRYLLECRDCGQRYVFEFHEEIDWEDGDDPSLLTYLPVQTDEEVAALKACPAGALSLPGRERLLVDHPKGGPKTVRWTGVDAEG